MNEILQFFQAYGFAGVVSGILFVWIFKLQDKLESLSSKIIDIVETNTKAMVELKETIKDLKRE